MSIIKITQFLLLTLFLLSCSSGVAYNGGGGSEITYVSVSVSGLTINGVVAPENRVALYHVNYTADSTDLLADTLSVNSDSTFSYSFNESGFYNIVISDTTGKNALLLNNINPAELSDTTFCDTLKPMINIRGKVETELSATLENEPPAIKVFIQGTPFKINCDKVGNFELSEVPQGKMTLKTSFDLDEIHTNDWPASLFNVRDSVTATFSADSTFTSDDEMQSNSEIVIMTLK